MYKKTTSLLLALLILFTFVSVTGKALVEAIHKENVWIFIDGKKVHFPDVQPFTDSNSRVIVPARFVSEHLKAEVDWDESNRQVTVHHKANDRSIQLWIDKQQYTVNSNQKTMDTRAVIIDGRTMVPLRFVSEGLGAEVTWKMYKGDHLVGIFTLDQDANEIARITKESEKEIDRINSPTEFKGRPISEDDYNTNWDFGLRWRNPTRQDVTIDDLPIKFVAGDTERVVRNIQITNENIEITYFSKSGSTPVFDIYLNEGNDLSRRRSNRNVVILEENDKGTTFVNRYRLHSNQELCEVWGAGLDELDISNIDNIVIQGYNSQLLFIKNPF